MKERDLKATGADSKTVFSPSYFSLTKFMVQFQKWRVETYVKACQQLLFSAVIDSVCKSDSQVRVA